MNEILLVEKIHFLLQELQIKIPSLELSISLNEKLAFFLSTLPSEHQLTWVKQFLHFSKDLHYLSDKTRTFDNSCAS